MVSEAHQYYLNKAMDWLCENPLDKIDIQYAFEDIKPDRIIKSSTGKLIFLESLTNINQLQYKIGMYTNNCDLLVIALPYKHNYSFWNISPKVKILIVNKFNGEVLTSEQYMKLKEKVV